MKVGLELLFPGFKEVLPLRKLSYDCLRITACVISERKIIDVSEIEISSTFSLYIKQFEAVRSLIYRIFVSKKIKGNLYLSLIS